MIGMLLIIKDIFNPRRRLEVGFNTNKHGVPVPQLSDIQFRELNGPLSMVVIMSEIPNTGSINTQ